MRRLMKRALGALAITVCTSLPGCWLAGWGAFVEAFGYSGADPLRVSDLRILAVAATPSKVFVDPRVIYGDESEIDAVEPVTLTVRADVVDPRGGSALVRFWMCAAEEALVPSLAAYESALASAGLGAPVVVPDTLTVLERCKSYRRDDTSPVAIDDEVRALALPLDRVVTFAPTDVDPFGPATDPSLLEQRFTLTPRVQRALAALVPGALRDFSGGKLILVVEAIGTVSREEPESETAFLSIDFRVDIDSVHMPADERTRIVDGLGGPPPCDADLLFSCTNDWSPLCGNGVHDFGEDEVCEGPVVTSYCYPRGIDEACRGIRECDRCTGLDHACAELFQCLVPLHPADEAEPPTLFAHEVDSTFLLSDAGEHIVSDAGENIGGHVLVSSTPLVGDVTLDAPPSGRMRISANLDPSARKLVQRERAFWQERDDDDDETEEPSFYDDPPQSYVPLRFKGLLTTQTGPCLVLYAAANGQQLRDRDEFGNQNLRRPNCTWPNDDEDYVVELPTRSEVGERHVLAYAFSDGDGAWRFGRITLRRP
jgi:hypothetical protein